MFVYVYVYVYVYIYIYIYLYIRISYSTYCMFISILEIPVGNVSFLLRPCVAILVRIFQMGEALASEMAISIQLRCGSH